MATTWLRAVSSQNGWSTGSTRLAQLNAGQTIQRVRFGWGFSAWLNQYANVNDMISSGMAFGLVTTIGTGAAGQAPNALTAPNNAAPPSQRWLHWEVRYPVIKAMAGDGNSIWLFDSARGDESDAEGQVLAPSMAGGNFLNLWASWSPEIGWDPTGLALLWMWAAVLVKG